jgi:hypothetical protein
MRADGTVKSSDLWPGGSRRTGSLPRMTTLRVALYAGYRYPAEFINYAAWMYVRFALSVRL